MTARQSYHLTFARFSPGKDVTGRLGRGDVNRSIGGNWNQKAPDSREAGDYRTRLKQLDDYANEMKKKHGGNIHLPN